MISRQSWEEIRRLKEAEGLSISKISRRLDVDRKTVRRCLRNDEWHPYTRKINRRCILDPHREFMLKRAPEVGYSATILFQELRDTRGDQGSYGTGEGVRRPDPGGRQGRRHHSDALRDTPGSSEPDRLGRARG